MDLANNFPKISSLLNRKPQRQAAIGATNGLPDKAQVCMRVCR
jgi:hypothetical protein